MGEDLSEAAPIERVSIDSRTIEADDLFIALHGSRFDGHDFVAAAFDRGAAGAVVSRAQFHKRKTDWSRFFPGRFFVLVEDPLSALQAMAAWHRRRFRFPVIGITGSNGKTTTKEMTAAILGRRGPVLKTEGNLNNHIGLPLSLLRLEEGQTAAVVEMGISHPGEMKTLSEIARPTVGLITNIGPAHLEFLGDLAGVAKEKGALIESLGEGTAVLNLDDPYLRPWEKKVSRGWTYAIDRPADLTAEEIRQGPDGMTFILRFRETGEGGPVHLPTIGRHQVSNALAAAAVARALGFSLGEIREGLSLFQPVALRTEVFERKGITILMDAYNANPGSMKAALQMLAGFSPAGKRKVALLGDMLELGSVAPSAHYDIGKAAAECGVQRLIAVGRWSERTGAGAKEAGMPSDAVSAYPDFDSVQQTLPAEIGQGDVVLVKGSRGMRLERVLPLLGLAERGH